MTQQDYLKLLVENIHSTTIATIGTDGHPQTRVIDMMLYDKHGVYFLTAKGKAFYAQLMEQGYIALSATKNKLSISLRGKIKNIGDEKLDEIFEKNTYMQSIYPDDTRSALNVFCLYEASILTSAIRLILSGTASPLARLCKMYQATMWAKAVLAASCATPSVLRNALTLRRSRWSSSSTTVCTAGGVWKSAPSGSLKRGFDHEPV